MNIAIIMCLLIGLMMLHVPIAFALGFVSMVYMWLSDIQLVILAQQIANGPDSWILLAMPLFVLAGLLMNTTGISHRLIGFAGALVGHFRGGLGLVNVIANMIMGGISGSAVADVAALGSILIPGMEKEGYPKDFTAALTSSAGSIGIIIPPSIPMIIFAAVAGTSVGALFIGGLIPGIIVGLSQMIVVYIMARRYNWGTIHSFSVSKLMMATKSSILALLLPLIIVGGILSGVFTPTEAGAVGVVYSIFVAAFIFRSISFKALYKALVESAVLTSVVMIIISTSYTFSWVLSHEEIPQAITKIFVGLSSDPTIILILFTLLLMIAGCFLHGDPIVLIIIPMMLPTVKMLGINLVHFGMIVVFTVAIGQQTPPVGSTLFVVSALSGLDIVAITKKNLAFIGLFVLITTLLILFPEIVLYLPRKVFPVL